MGDKKITRFGVAGLPLMTIGVYEALSEALGNVKIEKADYVVNDIRMHKTENELACMRKAAEITAKTQIHLMMERLQLIKQQVEVQKQFLQRKM